MTPPSVYIGIDVSKSLLDVAQAPKGQFWSVPNDAEGISALVERLREMKPALVVMEATGGYESAVAAATMEAALPVVVVNPRQVRDYARATGRLAKTDKIDAQVLAAFGEAVRPEIRHLPDAALQELSSRLRRRQQLVEMLTSERNRSAGGRRSGQRHQRPQPLAREAPQRRGQGLASEHSRDACLA